MVEFNNIPEEMKRLPRWCLWVKKLVVTDSDGTPKVNEMGEVKYTKVPVRVGGGTAKSNDPKTWNTFENVKQAYEKNTDVYSGVGFFLGDGYCGADLDNVPDLRDDIEAYQEGDHSSKVADFLNLDTYVEVSPSGNGVHALFKAALPGKAFKNTSEGVELYDKGRFFTVTGKRISESTRMNDITDTIASFYDKYKKQPSNSESEPFQFDFDTHTNLTEREIVEKAHKAKNGFLFDALVSGKWEQYYTSQSEADIALCNMLAFWTGKNKEHMDELFRGSGLMRPKWDEMHGADTYGNMTLDKAIADCTNVYTVRGKQKKKADKPPETMGDLYYLLYECGHEWRNAHAKTNQKTGETKIKPVSPRAIADILKEHCIFYLIGEIDPELSPLAVYDLDKGIYNKGERFIYKLILSVENTASQGTCKTVVHYLTVESREVPRTQDSNLIVFNNGIYNKERKELMPFSPEYIFVNKVSTNYIPNAPEPQYPDWSFSNWIRELSDGIESKYQLLWQVIASAIDANTITELAVFLFSEKGSTGKSTFQALLTNIVGVQNTSSLKIKEFEQDFKLASAYGRSLIIGDDNNPKDFNETSENFKSVITGDNVLINPKGDKPYLAYFSALVVQSMNGIPKFNDVSDGLLRRLRVIRFNHVYSGKDKNKAIKEKYIKDPKLLEFIVSQALQVDTSEIINTEESQEVVKEIEADNDKTVQFFKEIIEDMESERLPTKFMFMYFNSWCRNELNIIPKASRITFTKDAKRISERYGWRLDSRGLVPGNFFKEADVKRYEEIRHWSEPPYDFHKERYKQQGTFYKHMNNNMNNT